MRYLKLRRLIEIIGILIIVLMLVLFILMQIRINNLKTQKEALQKSIIEYNEYLAELEYKNSLLEEDYIRRYAREVLGYHSNNELIFKFDTEK